MTDLEQPQRRWTEWVGEACQAVGVDANQVDIPELHHLSKQVAHRLERPLAPVSTFILGLAIGAGSATRQERAAVLNRILDTLPKDEPETDRRGTDQPT
ncbi:molybdopterin-guanine dinucleotide biosynthesis protein A [Nostocoides sp. F2B08]|uniref:DUF6457 domain-containing protein n=1 Tax=Nostocoides sp. F2B08 TaxID=2653936 RepID=UPI001263C631|nr:DUF6457 domain-containing protein [Tetrasphaera sp. F2B08]KAB7743863.1 molybdopterin-guanine dinucleotide biosynthesis protein A [Tetrasphaera sp. F2B08]